MRYNNYIKFVLVLLTFGSYIVFIKAQTCPSGGRIYEQGISKQGRSDIVNLHNYYRRLILNGQVPNQPRGKNINMMIFDENLAREGRKVTQTCQMNHVIATDSRWNWVGQNLFISWNSQFTTGQDWAAAATSWFSENKNFRYPNLSSGVTGHYTQMVWATSTFLGCDFISYYDVAKPSFPYAKLYVCNYGPGGNYNGQAPYQLA